MWKTVESMLESEELKAGGQRGHDGGPDGSCRERDSHARSGAESASLVATICANGTRLPIFLSLLEAVGACHTLSLWARMGVTAAGLVQITVNAGRRFIGARSRTLRGPMGRVRKNGRSC